MKLLILVIIVAFQARAQEHWNQYCKADEAHTLIQFDPIEYDGPVNSPFMQFHSIDHLQEDEVMKNPGGTYYNLCMGTWKGYRNPSAECASYCMSALNLMKAIKEATRPHANEKSRPTLFKACTPPAGNTDGKIYARQENPECSACKTRAYNQDVQKQMEWCRQEYEIFTHTRTQGGSTGSAVGPTFKRRGNR